VIETLATTQGLTGGAALISALALLVHALRAALPEIVQAMKARADSMRIDAETRARTQTDHELTTADLRSRLDACDEAHRATQGELRIAREDIALERAAREELHTQLEALRGELDTLRRSIAAGGHAPPSIHLRKD